MASLSENASLALPFAIGAMVQAAGQAVNWWVTYRFNRAFNIAWNDNTQNNYLAPTNFDERYTKARVSRDFDVIQSVVTLFAVIPQILLLVDRDSVYFIIGLSIAVFAPVLTLIGLHSWPAAKYDKFSNARINIIHVSIANLFFFILYVALAIFAYCQ